MADANDWPDKTPLQRLANCVFLIAGRCWSDLGTEDAQRIMKVCGEVWATEESRVSGDSESHGEEV